MEIYTLTDEEKKKIAKGEKLFKELLMNQFNERIIDRRIEILKENNDLEYVLAFLKNKTRNLAMLSREEFLEKIGSLRNHGDRITYYRSEEHTSELQSRFDLVCRLLLEKKKT